MTKRPSQRPTQPAHRGFFGWLFASLVVHGGAVGGVVFAQSLGPARIDVAQSIPVELVQLGKERDPRLLPRIAPPPPPAPPPEPAAPPPPEPPPPAEPPPPPADAVSLDTEQAPKKPKKRTKPKKPQLSKAAQRLLNAGPENRLDSALKRLSEREGSPDGSPNGRSTDSARAAEGYQRAVAAALKEAYVVPAPIPAAQRRFLKATVVLFIDRNGRITKFDFAERHGNKLFMSALEKLLTTLQLPKPPRSLRRQVSNDGVVVIFDP